MLKQVEETSPTTRKLSIDIPSSVIDKEVSGAYADLRVNAKIPGFRVGKAPLSILERKYAKDIEARVLEKIIPDFYSRAVTEARIVPISFPEIDGKLELVKNDSGNGQYQTLSFTALVEIKPEIKDLQYDGIALKEKTFSVDESEVENSINTLRESRAVLKVSEGNPKEGDMAVIDCDAFIDDREISELKSKDYPFILGSDALPREFSEALIDKKKGDEFEIKVTFDNEIPNKTLAGKEVLFKVAVKEMKERVLPETDDEFAKGFDYKNMEELREKVSENLHKQKQTQIDNDYKKELVDHLIGKYDQEVPKSLLMKELEHQVDEAKQLAMSRGMQVKPDDELRMEYEAIALKNVKAMLIIDSIAAMEKIEANEDDIKHAVDEIAVQHDIKSEDVKKLYIAREGSLEGLKHRLQSGKVMDMLLSRAVIT
jgi:trigger factor